MNLFRQDGAKLATSSPSFPAPITAAKEMTQPLSSSRGMRRSFRRFYKIMQAGRNYAGWPWRTLRRLDCLRNSCSEVCSRPLLVSDKLPGLLIIKISMLEVFPLLSFWCHDRAVGGFCPGFLKVLSVSGRKIWVSMSTAAMLIYSCISSWAYLS